ncbi:beta-ketoacyl synthase domain-containing protein [Seiridium cupressi]
MVHPGPGTGPSQRVFLFGPQPSEFDVNSFHRLRTHLHETPSDGWALDVISELRQFLADLSIAIPKLRHSNGEQLLKLLSEGLHTGGLPHPFFPLPKVLLFPLSTVVHLTQYSSFLKGASPGLAETDGLLSSIRDSTETLGLGSGVLSAFAVACASTLAALRRHGAVAVRVAMLVGALIDAEEASSESGGPSITLSVSWSDSESGDSISQVLDKFPESAKAYVSVYADKNVSTVVAAKRIAPALIQQFKLSGFSVTEIAHSGRIHWSGHRQNVEKLVDFCQHNPELQLPTATQLVIPSRLGSGGQYVGTGALHEVAVREILLSPSKWTRAFNLLYSSLSGATRVSVISFGLGRYVPPNTTINGDSQLIHISDVDLSTSRLPKALLGHSPTPPVEELPDERIAVIGMSCHVPGAEDLEEYWNIIFNGLSQHREVPPERFSMQTPFRDLEPNRKWYGNFLDDYDAFDNKFFKKSPREMASTDPQHRLILKLAYQSVEQAGYFGAPDFDKHVGCYIGVGNVDYDRNIACYPANAYTATGNLKSFAAGKISHHFGWTGPSLTVDSACSSSGVAIHQACRAILSGECTSAIAGGVNVFTNPDWFHNLAGAYFLSPSGQCRPFDAESDGYCRGEGAGVVFLKRLSSAIADGDQVLGVIASTRVYQNQNCTTITAPSATSLSELFVDVVRQARLEPQDISVVEAHGTGTPVGDPAEYDGIRKTLGGSVRSNTLSLTAVKGILGHTEFASGILSLLKVLVMFQEGVIPPQPGLNRINPLLNAVPEDLIEIPRRPKPWNVDFRAALVNNYGASGSNASMVVTEAPKSPSRDSLVWASGKSFPFWFCGFDVQSLRSYAVKFLRFMQQNSGSGKDLSVANLSFQVSRQSNRSLPQALIFSAKSADDLKQQLSVFEQGDTSVMPIQRPSSRPVILCFGGQISSYVGLDKAIYEHVGILRSHLDQCDAVCLSLGLDSIYPDIFQRLPIEDPVKLQTALFATQYSCAKVWIDSGIKVNAVVGHSFGELTALCVAGAYSLKDALILISGRARLVRDSWSADKGAMLAVEADLADVEALLFKSNKEFRGLGDVSIACFNGPRSFTLAGPVEAVHLTEDLARNDPTFSGFKVKKLNVTNAFHSVLADPLITGLEALGQGIFFHEPTIQVERATERKSAGKPDTSFIAHHMRSPVYFHNAVQRLAKEYPAAVWLEAGSNSTITTMASRAIGNLNSAHHFQPVNVTSESSFSFLVDTTIKLWREGLSVSFWSHHASQVSDYTPLIIPPYQFEKSRHWLDLKEIPMAEASIVEKAMIEDVPVGLTTFVGYQDQTNTTAHFRVNTVIDKFQRPTWANILGNSVAVAPGMLQLEIVLDALLGLRPEYKKSGFQPEVRGISYHNILASQASLSVYLEAAIRDDEGLTWDWRLHGTDTTGAEIDYSSGRVVFHPAGDPQIKDNYESLTRLSGRKRCVNVLQGHDADDVLQGRNIYRAFQQVINYQEPLRRVSKIVGKDNESAGRVAKAFDGEAWIDPLLTESFCQIAGIFLNLMTDPSDLTEGGVFIYDRIAQWVRNPRLSTIDSLPEVWEVFAVNHQESDTKYTSDVFAFDPRDGTLVEAILGVSYQRLSLDKICNAVSGNILTGITPSTVAFTPASTQLSVPTFPKISSVPVPTISSKPKEKKNVPKAQKPPGPDVTAKTREMVCNLSGLEPEEIKGDSDLIELGIDSLMAMELAREVEAAFKCKLENDQLMELTDFQSLVTCIRSTLGLDDEEKNEPMHETGTNDLNSNQDIHGVDNYTLTLRNNSASWDIPKVLDAFREIKWATDDSIVRGQLKDYSNKVIPKSTELCVAYIVDSFEQLGCPIRSATPGQELERVQYLPKHERYMKLMYNLLVDARLIDISGAVITRTSIAVPNTPPKALLEKLLQDEPAHAAEHRLTGLVGPKFADLITGKEDGIQVIFGTPETREIAADMYSKSPVNTAWIKQIEDFIQQLFAKLPRDGQPINIFEIGAGTGGTTSKMLPLLDRLGVPVRYTMTDISGSMVAAARKRFKKYPFVEFKVHDIETGPDAKLLQTQHVILATNCVHATRDLSISTGNLHRILRPDGFLVLLEMTEQLPWVDFNFGLLEGWWLFEDGRGYVLQPHTYWEKVLYSAGYGHVDWTDGDLPEANIQRLIIAHASGPRYNHAPKPVSSSVPIKTAPSDTTERQAVMDAYVHKYTKDFIAPSKFMPPPGSSPTPGQCVLVTGATGSLGAHIVAELAQRSDIHTVVCLNRLSTVEATLRQKQSLEMRGITLSPAAMSKLRVVETDTSKPLLGLSQEVYRYCLDTVTHIVHSAWPMSLTRPVRTYETQFKIIRNLIDLAREVTEHRAAPFKFGFQFISSSAVVANYPSWTGKPRVPEEPMSAEAIAQGGYAEAKAVSERMLMATLHRWPDRFHAKVVRIAQISGSHSNGYWNPSEYMPFLVRSSQVLQILPDLDGTLSWCPVDDVAATLGELLMSETATDLIYHIDNPSRQTWRDLIADLAHGLGLGPRNIVPFDQWLDRVRRFKGSTTENPALQLIDFFEIFFIPMSCGGLVLDTTKSQEHSTTLRNQGPVDSELIMKYIAAWKQSGFLD